MSGEIPRANVPYHSTNKGRSIFFLGQRRLMETRKSSKEKNAKW